MSRPGQKSSSATTTSSREEEQQAPPSLVGRTVSLNKEEWARYTKQGQLPRMLGATTSMLLRPSLKVLVPNSPARPKPSFWTVRKPGQPGPHRPRSIFGLPVLSPYTHLYSVWSAIILVLDLTYMAFAIPISVAFQVSDLSFTWAGVMDLICGSFYFVEFLLGWHVGFVATHSMRNRLIRNGRAIAWYYIRHGTFFVDLVSAVAWLAQVIVLIVESAAPQIQETSGLSTAFQVLRILRLIRFTHVMRRLFASIGRSAARLPAWLFPATYAYLMHLMYGGAVLLNFFSCLWNFIALVEDYDPSWVNYYSLFIHDFGNGTDTLTKEQAAAIPGPRLYIAGVYYTTVTIGTIGFGDIIPRTLAEQVLSVFVQVIGIMFFGIFLGMMADLLQRAGEEGRRQARFREKMEAVRAWMDSKDLPRHIRDRIFTYYADVWVRQYEVDEETAVFYELPADLRGDVALQQNRALFGQLPVLRELDEGAQRKIAAMMAPVDLPPGHLLCREGQFADRFWILHDGEVVCEYENGRNRLLVAPVLLGELALLQEEDLRYSLRTATFRTTAACSLWEVTVDEVLQMLQQRPESYTHAVAQLKIAAMAEQRAIRGESSWSRRGGAKRSRPASAAVASVDDAAASADDDSIAADNTVRSMSDLTLGPLTRPSAMPRPTAASLFEAGGKSEPLAHVPEGAVADAPSSASPLVPSANGLQAAAATPGTWFAQPAMNGEPQLPGGQHEGDQADHGPQQGSTGCAEDGNALQLEDMPVEVVVHDAPSDAQQVTAALPPVRTRTPDPRRDSGSSEAESETLLRRQERRADTLAASRQARSPTRQRQDAAQVMEALADLRGLCAYLEGALATGAVGARVPPAGLRRRRTPKGLLINANEEQRHSPSPEPSERAVPRRAPSRHNSLANAGKRTQWRFFQITQRK